MNTYSNALHALAQWAFHRVSMVAGSKRQARDSLSSALILVKRGGKNAATEDETMQCPVLLSDVQSPRDAFMGASRDVCAMREKRRTRERIEAELSAMAEEANRGCGLSYELFVKRFSSNADDYIDALEFPFQSLAREIATELGYATPDERDALQAEIEESGGCSLTGIDPWCCPCGRHE